MTSPKKTVFDKGFRPVLLAMSTAGMLLVGLGASQAVAAYNSTAARPSGSFLSAQLPGKVKYIHETRDTAVGDIEHHTASTHTEDLQLSITASVLPGFVTAVTTDNMLYRKARRELLKNFSAHSESWSPCTHAGLTCRKLRYSNDDGQHGMARLYLHDDVLVVVNAVYEDDEEAARRFLDSVR